MNTKERFQTMAALLCLAWALTSPAPAAGQACTEHAGSISEHLTTTAKIDLPNSPAKFWCLDAALPRDIMTLNKLGANFATLNPAYLPTWINAVASGDIDLDGWPDFIGSSSSYANVLVFVRNMGGAGQVGTFEIARWIDGCAGGPSGTPTLGVKGQALDTDGHIALTSGDYDGDGDVDFLFVASSAASPYPLKRAWLYRNNLITNGVQGTTVTFTQVDMTASWSPALGGIGWSGTCLDSLKFDSDPDVDILFGNAAGKVFELTNSNSGKVDASTFVILTTPLRFRVTMLNPPRALAATLSI